jgi:hypothetical protein
MLRFALSLVALSADIDMDSDKDVFAMGSAASGVVWFEHVNNTLTFNRRSVMGSGAWGLDF